MKRLIALAALVAAVAMLAAACGDDDSETSMAPTSEEPPAGPTAAPMGPGLSVGEALASTSTEPLLVNGFIVAREGGDILLAELLAESYPPQAGGETLVVEGLDLATIEGTTSAQGVTWTDQHIQLLGTVEGGVLTIVTNAQA